MRTSSCAGRRLAAALLLVAAGGCSNATRVTGPPGDSGGIHLVVYASDRNQGAGQYDLYLYDLDAGGFRAISGANSATVPDLEPTISRDGRWIAFRSNRGAAGDDILLYDRLFAVLVPIPNLNTAAGESEPAFTGDVLKLAFVQVTGGRKRIRLYEGLGDTLIPLPALDVAGPYDDTSPTPDQTGTRIAFVSDRNGNPDVFVYDRTLDATLAIPELVSDSSDIEPSITPDGRFLCFASKRAGGQGGYDLYLYNLNARTFVALPAAFNAAADERHPSLSVDGDVIALQSDRAGGLGQMDVWNARRSTSQVGQGPGESGVGDEIEPSLLWP